MRIDHDFNQTMTSVIYCLLKYSQIKLNKHIYIIKRYVWCLLKNIYFDKRVHNRYLLDSINIVDPNLVKKILCATSMV